MNRESGIDIPKDEANPKSNESGGHKRQALATRRMERVPNNEANA
jgi:hypothetical protein